MGILGTNKIDLIHLGMLGQTGNPGQKGETGPIGPIMYQNVSKWMKIRKCFGVCAFSKCTIICGPLFNLHDFLLCEAHFFQI